MSKKSIFLVLLLFLSGIILFGILRNRGEDSPAAKKLSYQTYQAENGWGYRIFAADTLLLIQQDVIPGLPGSKGFDTESKAAKTAGHVISKIKKGYFPPTVSNEELDSLNVL